jgi:hypothetical protein
MSDFLDVTSAAMDFAFDYMAADVVVYQGVTKFCVASEKISELLVAGGFQQDFTGFVRVAKSNFPTPVKGSKLTVNGNELRIVSWDEDPISWKLYLEDVTR